MGLLTAFSEYQSTVVNADPEEVAIARERRDLFAGAFGTETDVAQVFCSGSLRRRSQLRPIHDVDMIVVFRSVDYPDWGEPGDSSSAAIIHAQSRVMALLGATNGTYAQLVRRTRASGRGRSVKCFIDTNDTSNADAFTVDVMPALRNADGTLLLPSQDDQRWSVANPEHLIQEIRERQREWDKFVPTVRLLKLWAREQVPVTVKSLVMEVLALHHLPTDAANVPEALRHFFTAAAARVSEGVTDPAGHCGVIQRDLDHVTLRESLERAADHAEKALVAAGANDQATATEHWQDILGPAFAPDHDRDATAAARRTGIVAPAAGPRPIRDAPQG